MPRRSPLKMQDESLPIALLMNIFAEASAVVYLYTLYATRNAFCNMVPEDNPDKCTSELLIPAGIALLLNIGFTIYATCTMGKTLNRSGDLLKILTIKPEAESTTKDKLKVISDVCDTIHILKGTNNTFRSCGAYKYFHGFLLNGGFKLAYILNAMALRFNAAEERSSLHYNNGLIRKLSDAAPNACLATTGPDAIRSCYNQNLRLINNITQPEHIDSEIISSMFALPWNFENVSMISAFTLIYIFKGLQPSFTKKHNRTKDFQELYLASQLHLTINPDNDKLDWSKTTINEALKAISERTNQNITGALRELELELEFQHTLNPQLTELIRQHETNLEDGRSLGEKLVGYFKDHHEDFLTLLASKLQQKKTPDKSCCEKLSSLFCNNQTKGQEEDALNEPLNPPRQ